MPTWTKEDEAKYQAELTKTKPPLTLEGFLSGKEHLPPGVKGLVSPEAQALGKDMAEKSVQAQAASFLPEGSANPLGWIANKTGLSKIPDKVMQAAVGMKKYIPGIGDSLIDQGVVGTKGMMQHQIESKLAKEGDTLTKAVAGLQGKASTEPIANSVLEEASKYMTPQGRVPNSAKPYTDAILDKASEISGHKELSYPEILATKRIEGRVGYARGSPLESFKGKLSQKANAEYGKTLEEAYANQNNLASTGAPNVVADTNAKLSALLKGQRGLNTPETNPGLQSLLKKSIPTNLITSVAAHGLDMGGRAAEAIAPRALGRAAYEAVPTSPPAQTQAPQWTPEDEARYQQALANQK